LDGRPPEEAATIAKLGEEEAAVVSHHDTGPHRDLPRVRDPPSLVYFELLRVRTHSPERRPRPAPASSDQSTAVTHSMSPLCFSQAYHFGQIKS
jgi:hypothetical protein